MNIFKPITTAAVAVFMAGSLCSPLSMAEPLMTIFQFGSSTYADTATTNAIVVTITRTDQDSDASDTEPFTVECKMSGGSAIENDDFRLSFKWPASGVWKVSFPAGVNEQSFTIYTVKKPGPNKTLHFELSNPEGPRATVTGNNPTTTVTIVNPPPPPVKKS